MEEEYSTEPVGTVDPEVRAHVTSLVSALGGTGGYDDGQYVLGDEALACLRDLKRWLKLYDEKTNRLDVARVLAERNLVKGDLLEILAAWSAEEAEDRLKSRVALACLELLVPLTWPIETNDLNPTENHYRNTPYLQLAQISYKREILEHPSGLILQTAAQIALGSLATPAGERTPRDEGVIKLVLYFYRNIAMISAPPSLPVEWNENEVSRSATIQAFHNQDIFALLLSIASSMGEQFNTQDVVLLEILFHLLKGVDVHKIFLNETELEAKHASDLHDLMGREASMIKGYTNGGPSRHNRFGTMIWVQRDEERVSAVSGQDVLTDEQHALQKMDFSKKWNKPKRNLKGDNTSNSFDLPIPLTNSATKHLRSFVEEFLDSGFNPLFSHLRRAIEREADRVSEMHTHQFFYLIAWFLEAERARREGKKASNREQQETAHEADSFALVASVLNQETFICLNRFMQEKFDHKEWADLNAGMRAFTQILLTVQQMAESSVEEDQEIADNIQNRIFYEETTHERVLAILRGYKDQNLNYLDACTELAHVFLRMLERYSKVNVDLQVRSRRRARKKKNKENGTQTHSVENNETNDSEAEELADAQRMSRERKFDFNRFSARFSNQACVDTFVTFASFYQILSDAQLKRALRYFHRVAFKQKMSVYLFRLDIIALFNRMIEGRASLSRGNPTYKDWEEFVKQLFRLLLQKLQEEEILWLEMLFSKMSSTAFYLEFGYEKQTMSSSPRAPAELEFTKEFAHHEKLGILIAAMLDEGGEKGDGPKWVEKILLSAGDERMSWTTEREARALNAETTEVVPELSASQFSPEQVDKALNAGTEERTGSNPQGFQPPSIVVLPDNDERRSQMYNYNKLRLLMGLVGFQRVGEEDDTEASWIIPSDVPATKLLETAKEIADILEDPPYYYGEDRTPAAELLRRKSQKGKGQNHADEHPAVAAFDEDSEGAQSLDEDDLLYLNSGPTARKSTALEQLKKSRRRRQRSNADGDQSSDDEVPRAKRKAKLLLAKSKEFIQDSDDDDDSEADREFFAQEEKRRHEQVSKIIDALRNRTEVDGTTTKKRKSTDNAQGWSKKRKSSDEDDSSTDTNDSDEDVDLGSSYTDETPPRQREPPVLSAKQDALNADYISDAEIAGSSVESEDPLLLEKDRKLDGENSHISEIKIQSEAPRQERIDEDMEIEIPQGLGVIKDLKMRESGLDGGDEDEDEDILPAGRRRANATILDDSDEG